jgi:hypothetical protein
MADRKYPLDCGLPGYCSERPTVCKVLGECYSLCTLETSFVDKTNRRHIAVATKYEICRPYQTLHTFPVAPNVVVTVKTSLLIV